MIRLKAGELLHLLNVAGSRNVAGKFGPGGAYIHSGSPKWIVEELYFLRYPSTGDYMSATLCQISDTELLEDLRDALDDVRNCLKALEAGVTKIPSGDVRSRLNANLRQVDVIQLELSRRVSVNMMVDEK